MAILRNQPRQDDVPAHLVLNVLAELSAAVDAMRHEMARLGIRAPGAPLVPSCPPPAVQAGPLLDDLSKRQRQVLAGIVRGCANKVIAWELGLSVRTVEAYRAQLFERLGARNAADAVRLAMAAGLVGAEESHRPG
jgi:DNA-binding NarL/FixJ family response regulator